MGGFRAAGAAGVPDGTLTPRFAPGLRDGTGNWPGDRYYSCPNEHHWSVRTGIVRPLFQSINPFLPISDHRTCPGCHEPASLISEWGHGPRGFGLYRIEGEYPLPRPSGRLERPVRPEPIQLELAL